MRILTPTVLMPGFTAMPTSRGPVSIDLQVEADPITFTPEFIEREMLKYGCYKKPDGEWFLSWKWQKEYRCNFEAQMGMPVFEYMDRQRANLREPLYCMDLDDDGKLIKRDKGRLRVFVEPDSQPCAYPEGVEQVERQFGIGMDVGAGVEKSDSTIQVMCVDNFEHAAEFACNRITPTDLGRFATAVGWYFNEALINCVSKLHGITTIRAMRDAGYGFFWYDRKVFGFTEIATKNLGWSRGEASSSLLFDTWVDVLSRDEVILHGLETWNQHSQYIYDERGKITHQALINLPPDVRERHGDLVVGVALSYRACCDLPKFRKPKMINTAPKGSMAFRMRQRQTEGAVKKQW